VAARKSRSAQVLIASAGALLAGYVALLGHRIWTAPPALPTTLHADAAIVLGAAIRGSLPGPRFQSRLDYGFDLLQTGRVDSLIVTGGVGSGKQYSEGEVGTRYLVARGADPNAIFAEHSSHDTLGNLCRAQAIVRSHQLRTLWLVSDRTHLLRAAQLARDIGMPARPVMSPSPFNSGLAGVWCLVREIGSQIKRQLRGRRACAEVL
jgi:vancomycin permeability regulator SanA